MADVVGGSQVFPLPAVSSDEDLDLWTYQDVVDLLVDIFQISPKDGRNIRAAMRAIDNAIVRLPHQSDWSYYSRRASVRTEAKQDTGTVVYTHSSRQLTLTGATWPSWASYGRIRFGGEIFDVEHRISSTVITLPTGQNPGADVASTTYLLWRDEYVLPDDFLKVGILVDQTAQYPLEYVSPDNHQALNSFYTSTGYPEWFTIRRSRNYSGKRVLVFAPGPTTNRLYEFSYGARPLPVRTRDFSSGTCSTSGTTVSFSSGTVLPTDVAGAVIRFSSDGDRKPTSRFGRVDESGNSVFNLPVDEALVVSRTSATALEVDRTLSTLSSVRFTISDPIDVDQSTMQDAFIALLESGYARFTFKDAEQRYGRLREAKEHIREAMQADYANRAVTHAGGGGYRTLRLSDFIDLLAADS